MTRIVRLAALTLALLAGCGTPVDTTRVPAELDLTGAVRALVPPDTIVVRIEREDDTTQILGSMTHWTHESVRVLLPSSEIPELAQALRHSVLESVAGSGVEVGDGERRGNTWFLDYGTPEVEGMLELRVSAQGIDGVVISIDLEEQG